MDKENTLKYQVKQLLESQRLGVLSTQYHGHPYSSLVAFSSSDNLEEIYFATPKTTRKFRNLIHHDRVSMLIDSRSNQISDFHDAMAVTLLGRAEEVQGFDRNPLLDIHLVKHPYLTDFANSASCAFIVVHVTKYVLVRRFQEVFELHIPK